MRAHVAICAALLLAGITQAGEMRDPMRPAGAPAAARPAPVYALKLEGIIAGTRRVAIINGRLVRAGETIAGARILEVFAHGVRYERAGKIHSLTLTVATANTGVRVVKIPKAE
jgi:hypothetical protein